MQEGRGQNENIMADKTPVRVVFNASNVATGMAEFQTGESIPVANGGTGLTAVGSAGQVLKVNGAGTGLEFGAEGDISITNLVAPTNADLTFSTSGTGNIIIDGLTVSGTSISSADSTTININDNVEIDGNLVVTGTVDFNDQNISNVGSLSIDSISGDADSNTSITFSGSDVITIATGGSGRLTIGDGALTPVTNNQIDLGTSSLEFKDAFFDGTVTSDAFAGPLTGNVTGNVSGTAATVTGAAQSNITSLGTLTTLTVDSVIINGTTIGHTSDTDAIAIGSDGDVTLTQDLELQHDGAILSFGANDEIALTHVHDTGLLLTDSGGTPTLQFHDSNESISSDGTDFTLTSGNDINLTATTDINVPVNVGLTFATAEKIESDGTDLSITVGSGGDINIGANIGITFGDDGEKIEGDGTDLTITGNNIKLTAATDVIIPTNVGLHFTDANEKIESDGSKLVITSGGTAFNLPTADGTAGQALVTDGSGTLSFDTVATTVSDDTLATVRNNKHLGTAARTIDSINATFIDSAFYFLVYNDVINEVISAEMLAITNNDSASFLGNRRGIETAGGSNVPTLTTDVSNGQFRLRAAGASADCVASFYKVAMSSSTTDATRGNTVTTSNTDVDSASESIDTFAHGTFRGAKYFISVDNDSKTEMDVVEALVVHDGTNAFVTSYGHTISGNNSLITVTAAISGDNVVVSAAGLETNLNVTIHKILLKDNMTAESNANQKAFASVTVSSTATAIDLMDIDDANGAVYFIVGANGTEGAYSIQEVYTAATPGVPAVANGPFVSTKGTTQLEFTAGFDTSSENSLELFASSTSGGSTTVSGYRISALAG